MTHPSRVDRPEGGPAPLPDEEFRFETDRGFGHFAWYH